MAVIHISHVQDESACVNAQAASLPYGNIERLLYVTAMAVSIYITIKHVEKAFQEP